MPRPTHEEPDQIERLLAEWSRGNRAALDQLIPLVYPHLLALARSFTSHERRDHELEPVELVHEVYLKLADQTEVGFENLSHFLTFAATLMRRVLVDIARARGALKRGAARQAVDLDDVVLTTHTPDNDLLIAIDEALNKLSQLDRRAACVVQLHCFVGHTFNQISESLGVSPRTAYRDYRRALHQLHRAFSPLTAPPDPCSAPPDEPRDNDSPNYDHDS